MTDIYQRIEGIISEYFGISVDKISAKSSFYELGLDSLDRVDLALQIETEWPININDDDLLDFETVGDLVKYVEERVK